MRKLAMALVIFCAATMYVHAQGNTSFGIKAGVNFASLNGDDLDDLDGRTNFHLGALAEFGLSETFSIQPEVMYSGQGAKLKESGEELTIQFDYINVPVLAKFYATEGLSLEVGPQFGFNINSKMEFDGDTEEIEDSEGFDLSGAFGVGYQLDQGIFFQARYNLGLTDVITDEDVKNGVFQFSAGFRF
ncbi:porin family protein [Christiangramia salexigens]|uniref:Outer membrane protein beta-barrel domain-containing protein n=1 Tax=Christiangramia salexigens TaxID=1913577 RepID=A0A1L3J2M2_9FLAO|nr:porin family protein [Christiangramia salexigens]APG59382.1 hypothetical protein LPB144_02700 [Christiangramia salexigens]